MGIVSFLGIKTVFAAVSIWIGYITEKHFGKSGGFAFGYVIGILAAGLAYGGLRTWLFPYLEKIDNKSETFKPYPYTEKYGRDYPEPKPENFGITKDEFNEYNDRFQFEFIKFIFTYGLWISAIVFSFYATSMLPSKPFGHYIISLIPVAAIVAILNNYLFKYWNKKISQKHRLFEKINKFEQAYRIYAKIRDENSGF
jgi:hypothetical protein